MPLRQLQSSPEIMSLKDSIYCESLIALFTKEEWYYQSIGAAEFSSSTGLNSTLAHCCISPVTVSQSPTISSSASYFTTSSFRNCGSKKIVYTQGARKVLNEWLFHVSLPHFFIIERKGTILISHFNIF